jgi:hypothetical protein
MLFAPPRSQILTVIFNLVWIGFALDAEVSEEAPAAAPITGDIEAAPKRS